MTMNGQAENKHKVFQLRNDVRIWIEQEAIHIVAFDPRYHDPVELTAGMARQLAAKLLGMADEIDE